MSEKKKEKEKRIEPKETGKVNVELAAGAIG